ncbi:hypothetical protein [Limisphaera sp. 4302-co]|uniref:hypothetical protein n=1 Tax=Limisphaera sp. 4302-co TaxID=3400417 RepID=UPI003C18E8AB
MRISWPVWGVLVALAGAMVWWAWPSPEKAIRRELSALADAFTYPPNEPPLNAWSEVNQICLRLTPDVEIHLDAPGLGRRTVHGREEVRQGLLAWRQRVNGARVEFPDIRVLVGPDRTSAVVYVTVQAQVGGEPDLGVQEFKLLFQKDDGRWRIARAESVQPLR